MEALLIVLVAGIVLFVPVGSVLGLLAFRQRSAQSARIESLAREISELREEVGHLRRQMTPEGDVPASQHEEPVEPAPVEQAPVPQDVGAADSRSTDWIEQAPPVVHSKRSEPDRVSRLTAALKENWMVWLGGLSVCLAGIFMVSHSISAGHIGPVQQLLLALFTGLALHAGAEFLRRRNRGAEQVFAALAGGGSITLYAALLAGVHHYELISPLTGLVGLAAVSLGTMVLALVHGPLLAIMGLSGAYLVPLLIGGEDGSVAFVLSYSFLITLSSLLLMRYVFRDWLWFATLAGALLWWLVTLSSAPVGAATAWYIAGLFVAFANLQGNRQAGAPRLRETLLALSALWGLSIADQPADSPLFWSWLLILPVAALVPQSRGVFWYLPWAAVAASAAGWLAYLVRDVADRVYLEQMPVAHQGGFLSYLIAAAILTLGLGLWHWVRDPDRRRWASLTLLSPVVWLTLGWLLLHGYGTSSMWAVGTLLLGGLYGALAWLMEGRERYRMGVVWAILAAHVSYSLAAVMVFREASLTLALSVQFISLTWLARRYEMPELYLLLKIALALVVARLTFNPWLQSYDASVHWSLWTYGGATLCAAVATWIANRNHSIRPWLEGATLHLLVLFLGSEMRYWLYDGNIFAHEYSFTEATINTLLWGGLSVTYTVRAKASESLVWLYRLFAWILLGLSCLSYLTLVTVHNPWWGGSAIGDTAIFNILLPAYGGPVLLALIASRFPSLAPRFWSLCVAAASFLLFTVLEIRQLWQGSEMGLSFGISEGELYSYSVVGMLYAIAAIIYATGRSNTVLYKAGMALLGLVIGKIFLIDMAGLQGLWRVAAFMGLGLALLGLAWLYRKAQGAPERG
ncbi:DUF2339 domain-containing protein [Marinobacter sp. NP-4(2019)]|uniref:DUF2339 domain-containing protein n=1 Tax=Marinobacter sp. NP-4(2019) TaxID=2488665 RepID=UPI000FC3E7B6|nr:DUF2339 domain-containing protein [Marinobacter sp. NP-4(2019)]AZT84814.1 DUF2339 domain-containing protein [Marinobacter sp. NP-4(2019)]